MKSTILKLCDSSFLKAISMTAIPVTAHMLLESSKGLSNIYMTAHLGVFDLAAIGFSTKILFIIIVALANLTNGGAVVAAQFWGANDKTKVAQSTAINALFSMPLAVIFTLCCFLMPEYLIGLGSQDEKVIAQGAKYLSIAALSSIPLAIIFALNASLRSIGDAKASAYFAFFGLIVNVALNYILIYGNVYFPAYGLVGAAYATLISSIFECILLILYIYISKSAAAFSFSDICLGWRERIASKITKIAFPLLINGLVWSVGMLMYNIIIGHMGTNALAVLAIIAPIEQIVLAIFVGLGTAGAVRIGNLLGGDSPMVWLESKAFILLTIITSTVVCTLIIVLRHGILSLFAIPNNETLHLASDAVVVMALFMVFRAFNITVIFGPLRSGGDTKFILAVDVLSQWAVGLAFTYLAVFYFQWPLYLIFIAMASEEVIKATVCMFRYKSKKWVRNLTA